MKKYIIGGIIGCLVIVLALGIANYYTCFAYYLPHKPAIIEMAPNDIILGVHPQWIGVPSGFNHTTIYVDDLPVIHIDNLTGRWLGDLTSSTK